MVGCLLAPIWHTSVLNVVLQLPLGLLTAATGHPMLVELKSGETLNGHLVSCDTWMNLTLKEVIQTSSGGDKFWRLPEIYVRGSTVSIMRSFYRLPHS
jgi:U6 snRNA-associated Sm-like protein LSm4